MVFDAFIAKWEMLPNDIRVKIGSKSITVFVFTDEARLNIRYQSKQLIINDVPYSYLFMSGLGEKDIQGVTLAQVNIASEEWRTMSAIYRKELLLAVDREEVLKSAQGLPFKTEDAAIEFFVDEVIFSREGGVMSMGLCLLEQFSREMAKKTRIKRLSKIYDSK